MRYVGVPSNELKARRLYAFLVVFRHRLVQARGGAVSEVTATTELVVVEALRMSNSLWEAMRKPKKYKGK